MKNISLYTEVTFIIVVSSITLIVWKRCLQIAQNASLRSAAQFMFTNEKKDERLVEKTKLGLC
jgi:hypothetical protein